jgi:ATP-dependent RNA helicase DDX23/PRP28
MRFLDTFGYIQKGEGATTHVVVISSQNPSLGLLSAIIMSVRAEPLSIESLLQKQRAEKEAASKVCSLFSGRVYGLNTLIQPKFLTKEERAQIAIAKRAQEIREQKEKEENGKKDREALERDAEELKLRERNQASKKYGSGGGRRQ